VPGAARSAEPNFASINILEDAMKRSIAVILAALGAAASAVPSLASEQSVAISATREDAWQFGALVYAYYPQIGSKVTFPNGQSSDVTVDANNIYNNLKFGVLGSFEARKGKWGMYTDLMYLNVGAFKSRFHNLSIGDAGLPADVSASANFDLKSVIWTLAGTYRVVSAPDAALDLLAGARLLDLKESLDWTLNGNIGQIPAPGRAGTQSAKNNFTDGIVGIKGRLAFGEDLKWFVPYYGDIGAGDSKLTWQAMGGLGYAFSWGEIIGGWRYLDYQFKSDSKADNMSLSGPMLGAAFHW
jgi:hypothetical protein